MTAPAGAGGADVVVRGRDMRRLSPEASGSSAWLNDEIVNIYVFIILTSLNTNQKKSTMLFSSWFFECLLQPHDGGCHYKRNRTISKWWRKCSLILGSDIFELDKLLIPICRDFHWTLVVAYIKERTLVYFDSLGGRGLVYLRALRQYLEDEWKSTPREVWQLLASLFLFLFPVL